MSRRRPAIVPQSPAPLTAASLSLASSTPHLARMLLAPRSKCESARTARKPTLVRSPLPVPCSS
eukprot:5732548-Pleurochrysis_carterae.AAC.1